MSNPFPGIDCPALTSNAQGRYDIRFFPSSTLSGHRRPRRSRINSKDKVQIATGLGLAVVLWRSGHSISHTVSDSSPEHRLPESLVDRMESRRRRFRFSLRTLLVVVMLLGISIGWLTVEARFVRQRKLMMAKWEVSPGDARPAIYLRISGYLKSRFPERSFSIPWHRRLLGDRPICHIWVRSAQAAEAERLFPEAVIDTTD